MLARTGKAGPVVMFTRNRSAPWRARGGRHRGHAAGPAARSRRHARHLDASADPAGDYAWEVFRRAEALRPGSQARLEAKARQLVGGPTSTPPPPDRSVYAQLLADRQADVFLTYCTNAAQAVRERPSLQVVALPAPLAVGADYGLTVLTAGQQERARPPGLVHTVPGGPGDSGPARLHARQRPRAAEPPGPDPDATRRKQNHDATSTRSRALWRSWSPPGPSRPRRRPRGP